MMPCDRDFGDIERLLRRKKCIYSPSQYIQIVKDVRTKNPFSVTEMTSSDFVKMAAVSSLMTKRSVTTEKQKIDLRQVAQFCISKGNLQCVDVELTHDSDEMWRTISFQKRGRPAKLQDVTLEPLYCSP